MRSVLAQCDHVELLAEHNKKGVVKGYVVKVDQAEKKFKRDERDGAESFWRDAVSEMFLQRNTYV